MTESQMTLAADHGSQRLGGWWASEKLDGCRAYWDGRQFWTRSGNIIPAPDWFTKGLPDVHLDGRSGPGERAFKTPATPCGSAENGLRRPSLNLPRLMHPRLTALGRNAWPRSAKPLQRHRAADR